MRRFTLMCAAALVAATAGCADVSPYRYWQQYDMVAPTVSANKEFSDELIDIRFWMGKKRIHFELVNKSGAPLKLSWDRAVYHHIDGGSHALADARSIFTRDNVAPPPTEVAPGGTIRDYVAPVKNVENLEEWTWYVYPLFDQVSERAYRNRGKTFGLDLPVTAGEVTRTYAFRFRVVTVQPHVDKLG
jgi:hypothetical protein